MISGVDVVLCDKNVGKSGPKCLYLLWSISIFNAWSTLLLLLLSIVGWWAFKSPIIYVGYISEAMLWKSVIVKNGLLEGK